MTSRSMVIRQAVEPRQASLAIMDKSVTVGSSIINPSSAVILDAKLTMKQQIVLLLLPATQIEL